MSSKTAGSPFPPQVGESPTLTNGTSKAKSITGKRVKRISKEDLIPKISHGSIDEYRQLLEAMPVAVYTTDALGVINLYNQEAVKLWGREPVIGKDMWCGSWKIYNTDGSPMELSTCPMALTLKEGRAITGHEIIIERPDGTRRNVLPSPKPIFTSDGVLTGAINTLIDITDWKRSENAVRESEATLRTIFENTKDSYILYDKNGTVLGFNDKAKEQYLAIHGTTLEIGSSVYYLTPPDRHELAKEVFKRCFSGESFENVVDRIDREGVHRWFKSSYYPVRSTNGDVISVNIKSSEITDEMKSQLAVQQSEATLKLLIENTKDSHIILDKEGNIVTFNKVAEELYKKISGEKLVIGKSIYDYILPEHKQWLLSIYDKVYQGEVFEKQIIRIGIDKITYHLKEYVNAVTAADGNTLGICITRRDITSEVEAEEAIKKSEANLRALFDNAKDGFVLVDLNTNILAFNHTAADLYSKVIGKKLVTNKSVTDVLGKELGAYVTAAIEKARAGESIERKSKQRGADGKEYWLRGFYNPVRSTDGSTIGICMGISDITTEMEANSFASEIAAIVQSSEDAIVGKTLEGIVTSWNPGAAKIFGYTAEEMIGQSITKLIPKDRLSEEPKILERLRKGEIVDHFETIRVNKKGELRNISLTISPIRNSDGIIVGASKIARDITEEKRLQDQLRQSELTFREELEKKVKDRTLALKEKNDELMQQKEFMETVLDSSVDQICVYDKDFRFIGANKVFSKLSGIKAHEILGKTFLEVFPSYKNSDVHQAIEKTLSTNQPVTINSRSKDNNRYYTIYCVPLTQNNRLFGTIVIAHDNTVIIEANEKLEKLNTTLEEKNLALQETNEELIAQKEFIETVIDSSVDYITVYDLDTRVMTMNKKTEELMNYKHGETIGKTFVELYPDAKDTSTHINLLKTLKGEATHNILPKGEMSHAFDIYTIPLKHNGKVYAALVLVHDITEIVTVSERLKATNELLEEKNDALQKEKDLVDTMIDSSVDFIGVYDKDLKLVSLNKRTLDMMGVKKEDMIGKTFWEINKDNPGNQEQYEHLQRALKGESIHKVYPRSAESLGRDYELFYIPLRHNNEVYAVLGMAHDVTEVMNISEKLRETNQQLEDKNTELEHSNIELERFAYVASHDLQEPLRKIQMFSGRIRERNSEIMDETTKNYFDKIDSSSERMGRLIKDILNYSRLNNSNDHFVKIDLNDIVNQSLSDFDLAFEEKNAEINIEDLPKIDGIPSQITQLFRNIIGNSLKFSREDHSPKIHIFSNKLSADEIEEHRLDETNSYYKITITDNGIGFDQEFAEKIFVIFQRLNERTKYDGTGIGLALCRKIVDNHHGIIYAESKEDTGAEFHIILPERQRKI